jgi:diguanylate cyclase (GGDEF)-like protein/PAS domain S-box-containing protein
VDAAQYRRLFTDLPLAWAVHEAGVIKDLNRAAAQLFAVGDPAEAVGRRLLDYVHPDSHGSVRERLKMLSETGRPVQAVPERMLRADGRELWVETVASLTVLDGRPAVQVLCWDITERVLEQERLAHAAMHDRLTGLPNRAMLEKHWSALLTRWESVDRPPAVLFCDLDRFKQINDQYGHAIGDATLEAVAARLSSALRSHDILGRHGGDEFVVLLEPNGPAVAQQLADRLTDALRQPISVAENLLKVGISVGLALPSHTDESLEALLRRADQAMYEAKRRAQHGAPRTSLPQ